MEARASNISGAAAYYAAEAREINKQFKTKQHDRQMGMFKAANDHNSQNKLDLHFLTTADAIKQLQMFIQTKVGLLRQVFLFVNKYKCNWKIFRIERFT